MKAVIEVRRADVVVTATDGTVIVKDGHTTVTFGRFEDMQRMVVRIRAAMDEERSRWVVDMLRAVKRAHECTAESRVKKSGSRATTLSAHARFRAKRSSSPGIGGMLVEGRPGRDSKKPSSRTPRIV